MVNALIEADRIELVSGSPVVVDVPRDDGSRQRVLRCPSCQIAVWSFYTRPDLAFVRAGTLQAPSSVRPDVHIFVRSKLPWIALPPSVPAYEAFYDVKSVWPAESLARLRSR